MKRLIAIVTCNAPRYIERANAQRETWIPQTSGLDVRFFLGRIDRPPSPDEVLLDVDDGYKSLPAKTQAMCQWALANGYDQVFKTDDDVYIRSDKLLQRLETCGVDYMGRFRGPSDPQHPWDYASGFAYCLSRRAMQVVAESRPDSDEWAEDRWVSRILQQAGVQPYSDSGSFAVAYPPLEPKVVASSYLRFSAASCQWPPAEMRKLHSLISGQPAGGGPPMPELQPVELATFSHQPIKESSVFEPKPKADLSKICILIKTFLRDGYLFDVVAAIERRMPEVQMVIVDDGRPSEAKDQLYARLQLKEHRVLRLPFDSGFGAKANAAIACYTRPYVLVGSDDFDFSDSLVRPGIEKLLVVLENVPDAAVASGRVNLHPYEGFLSYGPDFIRETPLTRTNGTWQEVAGVEYALCDLTVNYSLIRTCALGDGPRQVTWEAQYVIGGEHHDFFQDMKRAGWKVAFVPGVNIQELHYDPSKIAPDYFKFRGRAINCVGKFVRKHTRKSELPEHFYYIDFGGNSSDYAQIARQKGL